MFIDGVYRKHNNNFGYVSEEERNTPQAFSHYTYEASGRRILICDIQGVGDRYTDPQVHSCDGVGFGKGNMGERGVDRFIASHRCNAICRYLKLPKLGAAGPHAQQPEDEEGTMPGTRFMSYHSVDLMQINIRGDSIDPFSATAAIITLPPLRQQQQPTVKQQMPAGKKEMRRPLLLPGGRQLSQAQAQSESQNSKQRDYGGRDRGGDSERSDEQTRTTTTARCGWCCLL